MMLKLLTAPVWVLPWAVAKMFRARAVVRSGRRVQPVRVVRTPVHRTPVVVRVTVTPYMAGGTPLPPPPGQTSMS